MIYKDAVILKVLSITRLLVTTIGVKCLTGRRMGMKYIIDLPDDVELHSGWVSGEGPDLIERIFKSVSNGKRVPDFHGDLVDRSSLDDVVLRLNNSGYDITRQEYKLIDAVLFNFPTIISPDQSS